MAWSMAGMASGPRALPCVGLLVGVAVAWVGSGALRPAQAAEAALRVPLRRGPWTLDGPAAANHHVEALGERAGVWGNLAAGFEGWAYPFKMFDGLSWELGVCSGKALSARRQVAAPQFAQIHYAVGDGGLNATWFVPRSLPGALLLLEHAGKSELELLLRFRPVLAPMHLEAGGPLEARWDSARRELLVREARRGVELRVHCPFATAHRERAGGEHEIGITLPRQKAARGHVPVVFAFGDGKHSESGEVARRLQSDGANLVREAAAHYERRLASAPVIETPDPAVNEAMAWSVVSLDQLRVLNPELGYGLVSGYGPSGRGTRPKYCWFFEEPTLTSRAYHWLGLSWQIRESLRFLQQYQRDDGKTVHEVVQSLPCWTNYFREFPYAYLHSDGPVYYLFAYADYYRATGDERFIREEWGRIRKTLEWCLSAMDPEDGLMRIEPGDWGSSESSREVWKDTQLQGMWVRALEGAERLARLMGETELAARCERVASQASRSIDTELWDAEAGTYLWGLDGSKRPLRSLVPHHAVSFWLGTFPEARVAQSLERMAAADFRTDWGVRSLALSDPKYDPANYQAGSVWPVWNAGVIVSDYRHGRAVDGYRTWQAMVRARKLGGMGPMPEVLDGNRFQLLAEGVPHQMFSELAVVNGFFEGLLGLEVDIPSRRVIAAPRLRASWNVVKAERIPCGDGRLGLRVDRSQRKYTMDVSLDWSEGARLELAPELPAGSEIERVTLDGRPVKFERVPLAYATRVAVILPEFSGRHRLRIRHRGGVDWQPMDEPLTPGATSRHLRVVQAHWEEGSWRLVLEGLPGREYRVDLFTERELLTTTPAGRVEKRRGGWRVVFAAPPHGRPNAAGFVRWAADVRFR